MLQLWFTQNQYSSLIHEEYFKYLMHMNLLYVYYIMLYIILCMYIICILKKTYNVMQCKSTVLLCFSAFELQFPNV